MLIILLQLVQSKYCQIYQCSPFPLNTSTLQCIEKQGYTNNLHPCNTEYYTYCPISTSNSYCQLPPTPSDINISYIGETCTYDRNCLTSLCISQKCTGLSLNQPCNNTSQCNQGSYCNSTCVSLKGANDACSSDFECNNTLGCNLGKCLPYFSLKAGSNLDSCNGGYNYLCEFGACAEYNGSLVCLDNSNSTFPVLCGTDDDCMVNSKMFSEYTTSCQCGINALGYSYCSLAPGDQPFKQYISYMKQWLGGKYGIAKCHTLSRYDLKCISQNSNNKFGVTLSYFYYLVNMYPAIQLNDICVKEMFTSDYWNARESYLNLPEKHEDSFSLISRVVFAFIVLS